MLNQPAPHFDLVDQHGDRLDSDTLKGRNSLIVFIPFALTRTCTSEVCEIRDNSGELTTLDTEVIVITCNTRHSNAKWAEQESLEMRILSDFWPHGAVTSAYGTFDERLGCARRSTFVIDAEGIVRDVISTDSIKEAREFDAYVAALTRI